MSQVVIGDISPYTQAIATASQTVFGTNWTANYPSDVIVYQTPAGNPANDVTQILAYPADYSVAFIGDQQEVQVTLVTGAAAGDIITITRQTPADRENLYTNTNFTPSMLNNDFGILTLVDQQAQLVNQLIGPRYNYSAVITDVVDTILPILGANQFWIKNSNNTGFIAGTLPPSGAAPDDATYLTASNQVSVLPNSFQLLAGTNVTLTPGVNTLTVSVSGQTILSGLANELAYYASNGTVISGLATAANGILVTSAGGVPSISSTLPLAVQTNITELGSISVGVWNGTPVTVPYGGTGNTTFTAYSLIAAGTTATGTFQNVVGVGSANQVLVSQGAGALPQWASVPGLTPAALTKTDDTNVTLTLGGSPNTALLQSTSLTLGWTGQLSVGRGGTGLGTITAHNLMIGNGTSALTLLAPSATSGIPLISQGSSSDPAYGTAVVAGGGTGLTSATAYAVLCGGTTSTGAFQSVVSVGSSGQVLTSNGAGALPTFQNVSGTGTVNSGTINQLAWYAATGTTVSGLASPTTAVMTTSSGVPTWANQLSLALGGTNAALTADNGAIVYSTGSALALLAHTTTAGLCLLSGNNAAPTWSTAKPLTKVAVRKFTTAGSTTSTPTTGTVWSLVETWGAGGGGGSSNSSTIPGSGGGAGAYSYKWIQNPGVVTVVVGAKGTGGAANNAGNGTDGGDTTYDTNVVVAKGGSGAASSGGAGGAGGQAASGAGDVTFNGGKGSTTPSVALVFATPGGSSPHNVVVPPVQGYGSVPNVNSGAGGCGGNSANAGGDGADGLIIITDYISA
jgi:hypothetical protein